MKRLRVVLAEDHQTVSEGLRLLFQTNNDVEVIDAVSDGLAAVEAAKRLKPDVLILDLSMPGMNGLAAAKAIKLESPTVAIVVLTRHSEPAYVQELLSAGASGYVLKQSKFDELMKAVTAAGAGQRYLDPAVAAAVASQLTPRSTRVAGTSPVSDREMEVLRLSAIGLGNKDIAANLNIAVKTVEVHKANAMRKLQLRDRAELVRFAVTKGWLQDS